MVPRSRRLSRRTFPPQHTGIRLSSPNLTVVWGNSTSGGCAVVVSKKVARRSVGRHLIKRRIMAVLAPWCAESHFLVVYAREGTLLLPFKNIQEELTHILMKTKLPVPQ